jgi:hypothetical protein
LVRARARQQQLSALQSMRASESSAVSPSRPLAQALTTRLGRWRAFADSECPLERTAPVHGLRILSTDACFGSGTMDLTADV